MNIFGQIFLGALLIAAVVLLLKYNYQVTNNLPLSFAERYIGSGGSYLLWKIIAVVVVIAGVTTLFGFHDNILNWALSPLTNAVNPGS